MLGARRASTFELLPETREGLAHARTREEARIALLPELLSGAARWIDVDGLRLDDVRGQTRSLRQVRHFRRGIAAHGHPHSAVLDWSTTNSVGVDTLATFPSLVSALHRSGANVMAVQPRNRRVASLLAASGLIDGLGIHWVGDAPSADADGDAHAGAWRPLVPQWRVETIRRQLEAHGTKDRRRAIAAEATLELLAPVLVVDDRASSRDADALAVREFTMRMRDAIRAYGATSGDVNTVASRASAALHEAIGNIYDHAKATRFAAAVGVTGGRKPVLRFAISDDGIGIAAARAAYSALDLSSVPDRYFLSDVLRYIRAAPEELNGKRCGAMRVLRGLMEVAPARFRLRSGGVLVVGDRWGQHMTVVAERSAGLGTILEVAVELSGVR